MAAQSTLWKFALDRANHLDPGGFYAALLADAGEQAYRALLDKWLRVRDGDDRPTIVGTALLLSNAFDDSRAVDYIAERWPEPFPDEFAWRCYLNPPNDAVRRAFSPKVLDALHNWSPTGADDSLPLELAQAARTLRADDHGEIYLPLRRALVEADLDIDETSLERVTDELLIAAATGSPDNLQVRNAVLSYWGVEPPVDSIPTGEPMPGEQPASWIATCQLIRRSADPVFADRVIQVAHAHREGWTQQGIDSEQYLRALEATVATTADKYLLDIGRADVPTSSLAVRMLAARRRRQAGVRPPLLKRLNLVVDGMRSAGLLDQYDDSGPGPKARAVLAQDVDETDDVMTIAHRVAGALDVPVDDSLATKWAKFAMWAFDHEMPPADPVPAAPQPHRRNRGLFGRLFGA